MYARPLEAWAWTGKNITVILLIKASHKIAQIPAVKYPIPDGKNFKVTQEGGIVAIFTICHWETDIKDMSKVS